jgi:hypothetical protein
VPSVLKASSVAHAIASPSQHQRKYFPLLRHHHWHLIESAASTPHATASSHRCGCPVQLGESQHEPSSSSAIAPMTLRSSCSNLEGLTGDSLPQTFPEPATPSLKTTQAPVTSSTRHPATTDHRLPLHNGSPLRRHSQEHLPMDNFIRPPAGQATTSYRTVPVSSCSPTTSSATPTVPSAYHHELPTAELPHHGRPSSVSFLLPIAPKWVTLITGYLPDPMPRLPPPPLTGSDRHHHRPAAPGAQPCFDLKEPSPVALGPVRSSPLGTVSPIFPNILC